MTVMDSKTIIENIEMIHTGTPFLK